MMNPMMMNSMMKGKNPMTMNPLMGQNPMMGNMKDLPNLGAPAKEGDSPGDLASIQPMLSGAFVPSSGNEEDKKE